MNEKNNQMILEDSAAEIAKCHASLLTVCTAIQTGADVKALMPALWDVEWRLGSIVQKMDNPQR